MQNLKPGALDRLGFGPATLRKTYPRLIIARSAAMARKARSPAARPTTCWCRPRAASPRSPAARNRPARVGISIVDIATGETAYSAILEALIARSVTGQGADIRVSMFDVMADWLTVPLLHQEGGKAPKRLGLAHPSIAPYGVFRTSDGKDILISIQSDREWAKFAPSSSASPRRRRTSASPPTSCASATAPRPTPMVAAAFAALTKAEAEAALIKADVAFASVNDMAALSAHPHLRRITVDSPAGPVSFPAPAPIFVGEERSYGRVPAIGEHAPLTCHCGEGRHDRSRRPSRSTPNTCAAGSAARTSRPTSSAPISSHKFNATFDVAGPAPAAGDIAPRFIHFCLAQAIAPMRRLGRDGHPARGGFLPPVPLPRRMRAGGSVTFHDDLRVGDVIRRTARIAEVAVKEGKSGAALLRDGREPHRRRRRPKSSPRPRTSSTATTAPPAPAGRRRPPSRALVAAAADARRRLLFRYSAITFNGHRIHYDRRYAMEVEGYPGLVVHGPIQTTLLYRYAADLRGTPPARFRFRSLSPIFDDDPFALHGEETETGGLKVWTARDGGPVATVGEADWD